MIRKLFRIKKISIRITLYFTFVLIMIALVITILNIRLYSDELYAQMDKVVEQKMDLIAGKIGKNIDDVKSIHTSLLNDRSIKAAFQKVIDEDNPENILELTSFLDNHPSLRADNQAVFAIGMNGELYSPNKTFPAFKKLTENNVDFQELQSKNQYYRFSSPNTFPLEYDQPTLIQRSKITLFARYYNYETMKQIGYLAINFRKMNLFDSVEALANETFFASYVVDEYNEIVYENGGLDYQEFKTINNELVIITKNIKKNSLKNTIKYNDKEYSVLSYSIPSYERWKLITLFDTNIVKLETNRLNRFIYLTLLIAFIIMVFISWLISNNITNPIRTIINSMDEFEQGKWPVPLETNNEDEIKDLIHGYNGMLTSFIKLTDNIIKRTEDSKQIEIDLIKTQTGLLEAQINPHFIHNTLNSMNYLALKENNQELSKLIESFNKLLRTSMAITVSYVTVTQEIENLKAYALIQGVRFKDSFEIFFDFDEDVSIAKIPKLILQPIVENSIIHGILPKLTKGRIHIEIKKKENRLYFTIMDDGIGIEPKRLNEILKSKTHEDVSKHIGISNVIDRLNLYYGDNIHFDIESIVNMGTRIVFDIPFED